MTQQALDMPDGLRPPFYIVYHRHYVEYREEYDNLEDALSHLRSGEDYGELSAGECGDADGWLWRRGKGIANYEVAERAPHRHFYMSEGDEWW